MSSKAVAAVRDARGLSLAERCVLFTMADQADDCGYVWLGVETVADELETSRRTVQRAINGRDDEPGLVERGMLEMVYEGGGRGRPALFRLLPRVLPDVPERRKGRINYERRYGAQLKGDQLSPFSGGMGDRSVAVSGGERATVGRERVTVRARKGDRGVTRHVRTRKDSGDRDVTLSVSRLEGESWADALARAHRDASEGASS